MKLSTRIRPLGLFLPLLATGRTKVLAQDSTPTRDYWPTDDWQIAVPEDDGMDPDLLARIDDRVAAETPLLSCMLAVHRGDIVFESYYNDVLPEELIHVWSVTKSITGIAAGIAFQEGVLANLDQTLGQLIPDRIPAAADPRVPDITLEHLLTMTAGWEWDSRTNFARHSETDLVDSMLIRPMVCDPGVCFEYDSTCPNLISVIVQDLTGELMSDYLQTRLFTPPGISQFTWLTTPYGASRGAGGLELAPRDMARIGYLFLNGGGWDGQEIVTPDWVEESIVGHVSGNSALSGTNIGGGARYGYQWWVSETDLGHSAYFASGYGGQLIYVVPALDLVVVTAAAGSDAERPEDQQRPQPIIQELIVPTVLI